MDYQTMDTTQTMDYQKSSYSYRELTNSYFVFQQLYKGCLNNNKKDTTVCKIYKEQYTLSLKKYTDCLLSKDNSVDACKEYKIDYDACRDTCFREFKNKYSE